MLLSTVFIVNI